jgi:nucleoside-diphosphate-sugar epimerase
MKTVLVFNATGSQGSSIAEKLQKNQLNVIAPVRSKENRETLSKRDIVTYQTDFSSKSLTPIIKKADKVVLQIPSAIKPSLMMKMAQNAMDAILKAGYPQTVMIMSSTIPMYITDKESVNARFFIKKMAEKKLVESPILSVTEYLENLSVIYREAILLNGIIPQTIPPEHPVNYLFWNDLSEYVYAALHTDKLNCGVYAIGGNEGITGFELANRLGNIIGKKLKYTQVPHSEFEEVLKPIMGKDIAKDYAEFFEWQDTDGATLLNPDTTDIRNLLDIKLPSFEEWAKTAF